MKVLKATLKQTNRTCPSRWEGKSADDQDIVISFRTGRLDLHIGERREARGERDQFDVSSFIEIEEAIQILEKEGVEFE